MVGSGEVLPSCRGSTLKICLLLTFIPVFFSSHHTMSLPSFPPYGLAWHRCQPLLLVKINLLPVLFAAWEGGSQQASAQARSQQTNPLSAGCRLPGGRLLSQPVLPKLLGMGIEARAEQVTRCLPSCSFPSCGKRKGSSFAGFSGEAWEGIHGPHPCFHPLFPSLPCDSY